jgi:hypothetical protein
MAYVGNNLTVQQYAPQIAYFSGNGSTTAFTLPQAVVSSAQILVFVANVAQNPSSAYTVSGTTLTFTSAPPSGTNNVWVEYTSLQTNLVSPVAGSVTNTSFGSLTSIPFAVGGPLGGGNASIMKNRIINGAMLIDQRNNFSVVTANDGVYAVDRFKFKASQTSKLTGQVIQAFAPTGFNNSLKATSSSAYSIAAGDFFLIQQAIEGYNVADLGWGTANAKTITLSFWVYSSLTGTFGGSLYNGGGDRSYPFTYTISSANTWTQASITVAGDTTGTWATTTGAGIYVNFGLGVGSTYSGTAGSWSANAYFSATGATSVVGTSGATFYITGVQLEVGSSATGYEYRQYQQELALCQRYLPAFNANGGASVRVPASGINASSSVVYVSIIFPVNTRVPPTGISASSASHFTINVDGIASSNPTAITYTAVTSVNSNRITCTGLSGLTTGQPCFLDITNTSGQLLFTGCEL